MKLGNLMRYNFMLRKVREENFFIRRSIIFTMENLSIHQQLTKIQDRLLNFAYALTERREEAQDLLQETSLRVLDNQDSFIENTNFLSWSYTLMRNIFLNNRIKMSRRYGVVSNNYELYQIPYPSEFGNPEEALNIEDITSKISNLPP